MVFFVDLEKAFDTVNHAILIKKLEYYGIRGIASQWFCSYLSNRKQFVSLGGSKSTECDITCGVPQGSILGPLLFLIYINDMNLSLKRSLVHHFADDTNLLYSDKCLRTLRKTMNIELKYLFEWLCANRLSLNVDKTEFIIFRPGTTKTERITLQLNGHKVHESTKIKYLGILIDPKLSWKFHIAELCKKVSRGVGMIFKIHDICPEPVLKSLYYSLINSHLSYGITVWGVANSTLVKKVFLLQKRAMRAITKSDFLAHTDPLFRKLNILKLEDLYSLKLASLMYDYDHNLIPKSLNIWFNKIPCHNYETRFVAYGKLTPCIVKSTKYGVRSFRFEGTNVLNELKDMEIYTTAKTKMFFLTKLKSELINLY